METTSINFNSQRSFVCNQPFIISELINCLRKSHLSVPSHNGITYIMLPLTLNNLLTFSNKIWMGQSFLRAWSKAIVIIFPINYERILATPIITDRSNFLVAFVNFFKKLSIAALYMFWSLAQSTLQLSKTSFDVVIYYR